MNLTEFTAMVAEEANKGTRLDTIIPTRIAMAVQRGERKYTLKYMERYATLELDPDAVEPRKIAFPTDEGTLKSINFMRYQHCGRNVYLNQVDPADVIRDTGCRPQGWWLDGVSFIWFDNTVTEALSLEFGYNVKSNWPPESDEHWLLTNASDWLLAETMMVMSTVAREPSWIDKFKPLRDEAELALFTEDNELRNSDRDYIMIPPGSRVVSNSRYPGDDRDD